MKSPFAIPLRYTRTHGLLASLSLLGMLTAQAQDPEWTAPPKLVVGIVVDQMRVDYIYRYWDNFGEGGFKRLVREGSFQRDAHYNYGPTHTGPGHASIYTGTTPRDHGIVANDMFDRSTGTVFNCVQDNGTQGVGGAGPRSQRSPVNLRSGTLADELERRYEGRAKTIGVALKDRSAILPIGRTGDAAYWFFDDPEGRFGTSRWYMDTLPQWVERFNARRLAAGYLSGTWEPLLALERYHQALPDDNPYEEALPGALRPILPQDLARAFAASGNNMELLKLTPGGLSITTDLALAALAGEGLGSDAVPDLLAVSYSSTDEIGHAMGPRALELEDMYLRLDRELERLLSELDRQVGKGSYVLFLTADHAAVDVPEYLKSLQASAGYVEMADLVRSTEAALSARFGPGPWVRKRVKEQLFLNDSLLVARTVDRRDAQRVAAEAVRSFPGIAEVFTASDLLTVEQPSERGAMVQRGFAADRSGDVCFILRPDHLSAWPGMVHQGTEHGSVWNYDTQVPVLFFGHGVVKGEVLRRTSITDIAPTVCAIIGMSLPNAASGRVVPEVVH